MFLRVQREKRVPWEFKTTLRDHRRVGAQGCDGNATAVASTPNRGNELLLINIFSLWHKTLTFCSQSEKKGHLA